MHLPEDGATIFKCESCGVSQKVKSCKRAMSARVCAEVDSEHVWFSAFTDVMETFLSKKGLEKHAKCDEIVSALLRFEHIRLKVNIKSNYILNVE